MDKNTKKIIAISSVTAVAVTATLAATYFTTKLLASIALDREAPPVIKKAGNLISGSKNNDDMSKLVADTGAALEKKVTETVSIISSDGIRLTAHWYPCENAKRVVIAMHGWRSTWSGNFGVIADFWHDQGCSILFPDQRGQNLSGGDYMGFGLAERFDCLDWVHWAEENTDPSLPIYLAGVSMGATTVLMTAGLDLPARVHGIVADCGFTSPSGIWKHVVNKNLHLPYGLRGAIASAICKQKIHMDPGSYSTIDAMKVSKTPVLLIHGTDDRFVPISMTYDNFKACVSPKRLFVVPGAAHGMSYIVNKEGYERTVCDFFSDFDAPCQATAEEKQ